MADKNNGRIKEWLQQTLKRRYVYALIILCSIAFLLFGMQALNHAADATAEEMQSYISISADHTQFLIDGYFTEKFHTLTTVADLSRNHADFLASDELLYMLSPSIEIDNDFSGVGIMDADGKTAYLGTDGLAEQQPAMILDALDTTVLINRLRDETY